MSYPVPQGYPAPYVTQLPYRCSTGHIVTAWILTVLTSFYLLPWAIAATRSKRRMAPIVLINIFLGWTVAGWVVALVLACLSDPPSVVYSSSTPYAVPQAYPNYQAYPQQPQYQQYAPNPQYGYPAGTQQPSLPGPSYPTPYPASDETSYPASYPASQPTAAYPEPYPTSSSSAWSRAEDEPTQVIDGFEPPYDGTQRR